jgi:hypothetical protein
MLTDISSWRDAARAHGEVFRDIRPACTFVQVSGFIDPTWLVEISRLCGRISDRCWLARPRGPSALNRNTANAFTTPARRGAAIAASGRRCG